MKITITEGFDQRLDQNTTLHHHAGEADLEDHIAQTAIDMGWAVPLEDSDSDDDEDTVLEGPNPKNRKTKEA